MVINVIRLTRINSVPVLVAISAMLYGFASIVQSFTGINTIERMLALSDTDQLYLVAAALCLALAISLALPFEAFGNLAKTVATVTIDTLWFTCSALLVAAIYVAFAENRSDIIVRTLLVVLAALVVMLAGGWIWSDLLKAKPGPLVRFILIAVLLGLAIGIVHSVPLPEA